MSGNDTEGRQQLRNFEQKVINRSAAELICFGKLADYMLECCSAEAKPNTLSFCSFLPLFILSFCVKSSTPLWFVLTVVAFLLHQLLDIANKKQAYRLQTFSFATYYADHLFDTLSCILIVYIAGVLLQVPYNWLWFCIFAFGVLPFYTHHLTMYYNQYMSFSTLSPPTEGLLILEVFFLICALVPTLPQTAIFSSFTVSHLIIVIATVWLIIFLFNDLKTIYAESTKYNESISFQNLFVVFVLGYIMFEGAVIESELIMDNTVFMIFMYSLMFCFALIIGELILKYAQSKRYQQISLNTLFFTAWIVLVYSICSLTALERKMEIKLATGAGVFLLITEIVVFFYRNRQIMIQINDALGQ